MLKSNNRIMLRSLNWMLCFLLSFVSLISMMSRLLVLIKLRRSNLLLRDTSWLTFFVGILRGLLSFVGLL